MPSLPEIVGHQAQCAMLLADIAHRNVSHAYLFTGPRHLGKCTVARWFAWRLLSDGRSAEEIAVVKDQLERLIHPDVLSLDQLWIEEIQEDWDKIAETSNIQQHHRSKAPTAKTDTIGIKEIEYLQQRLHETGAGAHLCCIIRSIERMSTEAANAFLKVLEEPPPRVRFLLTAESEHGVLPTILSRTRVMRFSPVKTEDLRSILSSHGGDADDSFALHLAQGAPGTLKRLLSDPDLLRSERQIHGQAKHFWQATSAHERLQWIMEYASSTADIDRLLLHLAITLREHPDLSKRSTLFPPYMELMQSLQTNAHRGLLLERFALAVSSVQC